MATRIPPIGKQDPRGEVVGVINFQFWLGKAGHKLLADADDIVEIGSRDEEDVGRVVVDDVAASLVPVMAVKSVAAEHRVAGIHVEQEHVDSAPTVQRIPPVLAFKPVGITASPELIIAPTAEQFVFTRAAEEL